jgi:hypothetical protein
MARARRRPTTEAPNSLIASAVRLQPTGGGRVPGKPRGTAQEWQTEVWHFYDTCGELAFGANWFANAMSRVRLYIQSSTAADGEKEVTAGAAVDALDALTGGPSGQPTLMHGLGVYLFTPGEAYLIGEEDPDGGADRWTLYSNEEVRQQGTSTKWDLDRGDGEKRTVDTSEDADMAAVVIRIWRSHPRLWVEATSPVRAVLPIMRELEQLTKHVGAAIDSRLAGAGLLLLPSEMTFGTPGVVETNGDGSVTLPPENPEIDAFMAHLTEAMVTPIKNRDNASAVVPIVVRAPGALIGNAKHITFSTPLDEKALDLRAECIRRLALGLDMPPEVLLGTGDVNHWGAWQIDEASLKTHIEPACELICTALTERYLYPVLEGQGTTVTGLRIAPDTSDLRLRPNRGSEAFDLYDRLEIGGVALRRETGFEEGDAPDTVEREQMLLMRVAGGAPTPDLTAAALDALGVPLTPQAATVEGEQAPAATEPPALPAPTPSEENVTGPPEPQAAALLACSEVVVHRAIERANNRVNNRAKIRRPIPEDRMSEALRGAWDYDLLRRVATVVGIDVPSWVKAMERYTTIVLATGEEHSTEVLARVLHEYVLGTKPFVLGPGHG